MDEVDVVAEPVGVVGDDIDLALIVDVVVADVVPIVGIAAAVVVWES